VHDTFLVALRKIDRVRVPAAGGELLHAILRNACLMRLRTGQGEILSGEMRPHAQEATPERPIEDSIDRLAMHEWVWTRVRGEVGTMVGNATAKAAWAGRTASMVFGMTLVPGRERHLLSTAP
jgi:RNA polymerase sigma-70 factor (ECF subfamily)